MKKQLLISFLLIPLLFIGVTVNAQYFTPVWSGNPYNSMALIITSSDLDGLNLQVGDSVAVLDIQSGTGDLICVGATVITSPGSAITITASEEDTDPPPQPGFTDGNSIIWLIWDDSESKIISLIDPTFNPGFDVVFSSQGTAVLTFTSYSVNVWDGSTSNSWNDGTNWNTGLVTDSLADVEIPASGITNYPTLSSAGECNNITIKSSSAGTGSLMDNGNLTVNGKATVQTYLSNSAGADNFHIHLIGPTVDEENYTGTGTGAYLSAFNIVPGSTYAYGWNEGVPVANGWENLSSLTHEIQTATGIGLSTTDNTPHTLSLTGDLITGDVSTPSLSYSNNHYELISNPYPSAIDFDALATANTSLIQSKYWIWDPVAGNYVNRGDGGGASQYIQVGQGFFVETKMNGIFDFTNAEREHNGVVFRTEVPNMLTTKVTGGESGYKDEMFIRFKEGATFGYDEEIEVEKWDSQYDDGTMIRSVADDGTELAINALPYSSLNNEMVSVPLLFHCGYEDEYTLEFKDVESFDSSTEIWLQDNLAGGDWFNINGNPVYAFNAAPDDANDRFMIHFFGPTGISPNPDLNTVKIYAYQQDLYLLNQSNEALKQVVIYDLAGRVLKDININNSNKINKIHLSGKANYYIVKVITNDNIYSEKVFASF